ncbi:MAG: hypothetical protein ACLQU5_03545, partial [Isosphaeraceae bacterium]
MSNKPPRVPSAEQLTELLQAIVPFMNLNRYAWKVTWCQEDYALPLFVRLADVLRPIRLRIDAIKGWPPRIESSLRIVIESFDATAAAWGWERVVEPEPAAYIEERNEWFLETVERPVYEAALSMQAGFRGLKRPRDVDDLADKGRDLGFQATMTPNEGEAQYPVACERWHEAPRLGTCYPRIGEQEEKNLGGAYNLIAGTLKTVRPPTDAPRLDGRNEPPKAPAELPDLVTLDQAAALVNRQPNGLSHYRKKGMPKPQIHGRKGKPNEYLWSEMRPWLEETFGRKIPELAIMKFRTSRGEML